MYMDIVKTIPKMEFATHVCSVLGLCVIRRYIITVFEFNVSPNEFVNRAVCFDKILQPIWLVILITIYDYVMTMK